MIFIAGDGQLWRGMNGQRLPATRSVYRLRRRLGEIQSISKRRLKVATQSDDSKRRLKVATQSGCSATEWFEVLQLSIEK